MQIGDLFETRIAEKIEPVIKVGERGDERKLLAELGSYVVTPNIGRYLCQFLEHYTDTFLQDTTEIGVWISGYFGSGKSHLAKVMGLLAENRVLGGATATLRFEARLPVDGPHTPDLRRTLSRMSQCETTLLAFNVQAVAEAKTTLARVLLGQFYKAKGYCSNLIYARVVEAELDRRGRLAELHEAVTRASGQRWSEVQKNPTAYGRFLYKAASEILPELFPTPESVEQALAQAQQGELYNTRFLIETLLTDLTLREATAKKRQRLLLVLDEVGQWLQGDPDRLNGLQALIEETAIGGQGRIWVVVTTHGDMGTVLADARAHDADMKKIEGRFRYKFSLTTENIELVLEDRLFKKTPAAKKELEAIYKRRGPVLREVGELRVEQRQLPPCTSERFTTNYPFLPYQVGLIPDVVKSLRSRGGRGEQLSGSTRTLLAITQDILRAGRRPFLEDETGPLISFDEVYANLAADGEVLPDVRDDLARIPRSVPGATAFTMQVAEVLYLVRELSYLPRTLENLARLHAHDIEDDVASLTRRVEPELQRLQRAHLVGRAGDEFEFLTGEKRTFEQEVAAREGDIRSQEIERGLRDHFVQSAGQVGWKEWLPERVSYLGLEFSFKLSIDTYAVSGREGDVTLSVYTPLARVSLPEVEDRSLRADEQNTVFILSAQVPRLSEHVKRYLALREVIEIWKGDSRKGEPGHRLAEERRSVDLPRAHKQVMDDLREGLSRAQRVFRGAGRPLALPPQRDKVREALQANVSELWSVIYPKLERLPVRVSNEDAAIREVLEGKTGQRDLVSLGLFDKGGKLDPSSVLIDTLRTRAAEMSSRSERVLGGGLIKQLTQPPYGWDANAVRVGVAALVRAAAMKVLLNKKELTNPADPELVDALRVLRTFEKVELVLENTEIEPEALAAVRVLLRGLLKRRDLEETAAALSQAAEEAAIGVRAIDTRLRLWAGASGFPLPAGFSEAIEQWGTVAALKNALHRVRELHTHLERLKEGHATIISLSTFQEKEGPRFLEMARLAAELQAVEHHSAEGSRVRVFLRDWENARVEASIADNETWRDLRTKEGEARLELSTLLDGWREEAKTTVATALREPAVGEAERPIADEKLTVFQRPLKALLDSVPNTTGTVRVAALPERARRLVEQYQQALQAEIERRRRLDIVEPGVKVERGGGTVAPVPLPPKVDRLPPGSFHFTSLEIGAFRGLRGVRFEAFSLVNLIVCRNNGGKTSVLEAVAACCLPLNAPAWMELVRKRALTDPGDPLWEQFFWLLPHGEQAALLGEVSLSCALADGRMLSLKAMLKEDNHSGNWVKRGPDGRKTNRQHEGARVVLHASVGDASTSPFSEDVAFRAYTREQDLPTGRTPADVPFTFITPMSHRSELFQILAIQELSSEDTRARLLRLLRQFDPQVADVVIEGVGDQASIIVDHHRLGRSPVSTFGDGLRRSLAMALGLLRCQNGGVLLIDEIESGIHFSALQAIYTWLTRAAEDFSVQLFITTHSLEALDAMLMASRGPPAPAEPSEDDEEMEPEEPTLPVSFYRLRGEAGSIKVARLSGKDAWDMRKNGGMELR